MTVDGLNTTEFREREKQRVRCQSLATKHVSDCVLLPTREQMLDAMPQDGHVAEIGVAFGDFTTEILKRAHPRKLYLVDAWAMDRYSAGLAAIRHRFDKEISEDVIRVVQGYSTVAMSTLPDS
jgi:tRNA G46 methylase TrmB